MANPVRFPALLDLYAICYSVGKTSLGCPPLTKTEASEHATISQNQHFQRHCTHDMIIWKGWRL